MPWKRGASGGTDISVSHRRLKIDLPAPPRFHRDLRRRYRHLRPPSRHRRLRRSKTPLTDDGTALPAVLQHVLVALLGERLEADVPGGVPGALDDDVQHRQPVVLAELVQ